MIQSVAISLKVSPKMHLKMSSALSHLLHRFANVIDYKCNLLTLVTNYVNIVKQCGPRSDCSSWSSLIWFYTVCQKLASKTFQQMTKQTTFVVICTLRVTVNVLKF